MSLKFVQTQAVALYSPMSAAATSCIITPYPRDIQTNAKLVFADFGTTPTFTVDPKIPGYEEICSFTGITDNGDGTATLTGLTRNLIGQYPYTTAGTGKQHGSSAVIVFSDNPQMYARLASLDSDNVFTGINEGVAPTTAMGFVTRDYMLALINGGAISVNALIEAGIAGETFASGSLVYFSETENEWMKCDADTLATVFNVKLGIAQGAGTNGVAIPGGVLTRGLYTTSGLTQGDLVYASNTAGAYNSGTAGTTPRVIGIAKDSTHLYFDPDFQNFLYNYAVDAVGTDSYAVTLAGAYGAYYPGMLVAFKAGTANTGAASLNVNGLGAKTIKKNVSDDLITGDILANQIVLVQYDGTSFLLLSKTPTLSPTIQTFTASGTYTKPAGMRYAIVEVQGAGGIGAAGATGGGGGGGGAYSKKIIAAASIGVTETITIGTAGLGSGNTSFGALLVAPNGNNASGQTGGAVATASGGDININGQKGQSGSNQAGIFGGAGGASMLGNGGAAGQGINDATHSNDGEAGGGYGGGGGGTTPATDGTPTGTAGAGTTGIIIVTEFY